MTARDVALIELDHKSLPGWPANRIRRRAADPSDPRDRALVEQLVVGTVKNALLLQYLIEHYSGRTPDRIDPIVQKILALALYQLRFLSRIPPSAAVDQAVEQTRRFGRPGAAGLVNAVLRNALRNPDAPLPDADDDPSAYAQIVLSHPPELFARLCKATDPQTALAIARRNNAEPPTIVRLFAGASPESLRAPEVTIHPHQQPGLYVVQGAKKPLLARWARQGIAQVQDPTAAGVVAHCDIHPGQTVLDRCAGLGTKTRQIVERLEGIGRTVAMDPNERRMQALRRLAGECGLTNLDAHVAGAMAQLPPSAPRGFDRVLVDAPCSNSGVLSRRPEARYAQDDRALAELQRLGDRILDDTAGAVARDGLLIYSTCSIWAEENQERIQRFLGRHEDYRLLHEQPTLPHAGDDPTQYHDGGYVAVLKKVRSP